MEWVVRGLSAFIVLVILWYTWRDLQSGGVKAGVVDVSRSASPLTFYGVIVARLIMIGPSAAVALGIIELA